MKIPTQTNNRAITELKKARQSAHPLILASCVGAVACLLLSTSAQAATTSLYWDGDGTGASGTTTGLGGTGTWDTTTSNWWTGSAYTVWPNTSGTGTAATFAGTAGTVTVASGGVTVGSNGSGAVMLNTAGYTFTGGTLNYDGSNSSVDWILYRMVATGSLTVNNNTSISTYAPAGRVYVKYAVLDNQGSTLTVNGNIGLSSTETAGTKSLEFKGGRSGVNFFINGTIKDYLAGGSGASLGVATADLATNQIITLTGVNSYSGGTDIRGGTVIAMNSSAVGTGNLNFSTQAGAFLTGAPATITNTVIMNGNSGSAGVTLGSNSAGVSNFTGDMNRWNTGSAAPLAFTAVTGGTVNILGHIQDNSTGSVLAVTKTGQGVVNIAKASGNYYGAGTNVTEGTLLVNNTSGSATGSGAVKVNSASASSASYTGAEMSYTYTVADTTGLAVGQSVTGTYIAAGTYIVAILNSTQLTLSTAPSGILGAASGTLNFGAASGTLGGTGIISGATTVSSGATIAPGNFSDGTLTLGGGLNLQGTYAWEINANNDAAGFDKITLTAGDLTLGAASTLDISALAGVNFTNDFWKTSHNWTVINNTGTGVVNGTFSALTGLTSNAEGAFSLSYGTGSGADTVLTWEAVPEPSTWAFVGLGLGMAFLGMRQRNRRLS